MREEPADGKGCFLGQIGEVFILHAQGTDWSKGDSVFLLTASVAISFGYLCRPIPNCPNLEQRYISSVITDIHSVAFA